VRDVIRAPLAARIREFFDSGTILEIGCGSGWLARMLAGNGIRVVGVDFSERQIGLAKERLEAEGLSEVCEFRAGDLMQALDEPFENVLVHASLHHLAEDELSTVLARLGSVAGRRVFAYEPIFPAPPPLPPLARRVLRRIVRAVLAPRALRAELPGADAETLRELDRVVSQSTTEGWFFSPKEVPLAERRFTQQLDRHFIVHRAYPIHHWSLQLAQKVGLIDDEERRRAAVRELVVPALRRDEVLFRTKLFRVLEDEYLFFAFELEAR
jgi:SAM-dependent methyltransferase